MVRIWGVICDHQSRRWFHWKLVSIQLWLRDYHRTRPSELSFAACNPRIWVLSHLARNHNYTIRRMWHPLNSWNDQRWQRMLRWCPINCPWLQVKKWYQDWQGMRGTSLLIISRCPEDVQDAAQRLDWNMSTSVKKNLKYRLPQRREIFGRNTGNFESSCNCCTASRHETKSVTLACSDGTYRSHSYNFITACACKHTNCFAQPWGSCTNFVKFCFLLPVFIYVYILLMLRCYTPCANLS